MKNEKKKILVFDDEKAILDVFTIIFGENGYEVEISETSHDIIERVADFQPDLILMDNWIPNIGGIEALKLLKENEDFRNIPVIYISANSDINSLAKKAQADDYIAKPFDLAALETMVEKLLFVH
ncbi:response regulator receiver protein [Chryseobacterium sp. Leaf405]|uniref:response regulator n=1 Tax=Chryseobacterium sp. Leaf405 TaxID=1736367 RepID=UPI0006FA9582|nr:response regulator [Chryseobacterium sp. Leaf405]KQT35707.1 response regulator receiver protein [Chryseobacterium sp. Leaf405]